MSYLASWSHAFLLTVVVEVPLVVGLARGGRPSWQRRALLALFAQLATHPVVWYVFPAIPGLTRGATFALSEVWAWLVEAALYATADVAPSPVRAAMISGVANGASLAMGLLLL